MGFRELIAAHSELLNRNKLLPRPFLYRIYRRRIAQAVDGDKRRQQSAVYNLKSGGIRLIDIDRLKW